jgi:hypothetical protein
MTFRLVAASALILGFSSMQDVTCGKGPPKCVQTTTDTCEACTSDDDCEPPDGCTSATCTSGACKGVDCGGVE